MSQPKKFASEATQTAIITDLESLYSNLSDALEPDEFGCYPPPLKWSLLTQILRRNAHHESALDCKTQTVVQGYRAEGKKSWEKLEEFLPREDVEAFVFDLLVYGNGCLEPIGSRGNSSRIAALRHVHARTLRKRADGQGWRQIINGEVARELPRIIHVRQYAPESSVYGLPRYLGALLSIRLNQSANHLRIRWQENDAHLGFLLLLNVDFAELGKDEDESQSIEQQVIDAIKGAKREGYGKPMYLNLGGIEVDLDKVVEKIGFADDVLKDDFRWISEVSRDNILSSHRVPPEIIAVVVERAAASNLEKVVRLYNLAVVQPLQRKIANAINRELPKPDWIGFDPFDLPEPDAA